MPFVILGVLLIICWFNLLKNNITPTIQHDAALVLFFLNLLIYFIRFRPGLLLTGILLLLATLNIVNIFAETLTDSLFIGLGRQKLVMPPINGNCFLLLLAYIIINYRFFKDQIKTDKARGQKEIQ
ncbi:hypothetical protein [Taibaiella koreensis]|uniref:hypothetical protein n=1 Tax=Taibaiella koreensis TaxID=1268548 RepID=UPI0013C3042C|nr:hypothetical protein [Taibaiella koreensis]